MYEGGGQVKLFWGANVIDGRGAASRREVVLVQGERIAALGAAAEQRASAENAKRVDLAGLTLMPGLIDARCHVTFDEAVSNDELFFIAAPRSPR